MTAEALNEKSDWDACLYTTCCLCPAFPCVSHLPCLFIFSPFRSRRELITIPAWIIYGELN